MTIHQDWHKSDAQLAPVSARVSAKAQEWVVGVTPAPARSKVKSRPAMPLSKRLFDVIGALVLLVPLSVVMLFVAGLLLVVQGRPILYRAQRMQAPGKAFTQLKFRTMTCEEQDYGATGAHKHWRITRIGHFLRRTRIDELPQLFNILWGQMSFVGPRPPLPEYVERFPSLYAQVLKSRPGVTGMATLLYHRHEEQIMARCASAEATEAAYYRRCLPTKLKIDMIYQRNRSIGLDLWIMWNTIKVVTVRDQRPRRRKG